MKNHVTHSFLNEEIMLVRLGHPCPLLEVHYSSHVHAFTTFGFTFALVTSIEDF
nr:hypothetical protein [Candidatus Sigynarchaeota archaeon]